MKEIDNEHKYVVRADFYGTIPSNQKRCFWVPVNSGVLYLSGESIHYREFASANDTLVVDFKKIIKIKIQSLNPRKNKWSSRLGNPFCLMFWNPFWNRYIINLTFLSEDGLPHEVFFKLKTKKITVETMDILKRMLSDSVITDSKSD